MPDEITDDDEIIPCKLCGTTSNQLLVRIRDYCERCYTKQFIEPLKKEERNLNDALATIRNHTMEFLHELGEAKRLEQTYRLRMNKSTKTLLCIKCRDWRTDSTVKLMAHESDCLGNGMNGKKPKSVPRPKSTKPATMSDAEDLFG